LISRTATLWAWLSIVLPFSLGWLLTGTISGALLALLWASGVRILLLHHVTWAVNSVGHMFGRRPFRTRDRSTNFAPLALLSCGDSWHNAHHAYPRLARHGLDPGRGRLLRPAYRCLRAAPLGVGRQLADPRQHRPTP